MSREQVSAAAADLARLRAACADVRKSLADVAALLPEPQGKPKSGTIGRHPPEPSEPWQGEAAACYWTIHFGTRRLEDALRDQIGLGPHLPPRGGSALNTTHALGAIEDTGPTLPAEALRTAVRKVERWAAMIDQLSDIDQADVWTPVPRQPGAMPPACPYCDLFTLRMTVRREIVRCFNPPCRDNEGRPPVARMDRNKVTGDGVLVFADQTVIHYRGEAAETA